MGATARRSDLPASAQACVSGVGATHTHPSWRSFATIAMQPVPPDRYEISFTDVPVNTRVSFRVNDQNACDENPTGAVTRNVLANDVRLIQNATTLATATSRGLPSWSVRAAPSVSEAWGSAPDEKHGSQRLRRQRIKKRSNGGTGGYRLSGEASIGRSTSPSTTITVSRYSTAAVAVTGGATDGDSVFNSESVI